NNPERVTDLVSTSIKYLQSAIEENRKIAHALVVPDFNTKDLVDQVFNLTDSMLITSGIKVNFDISHFQQERINDQQKLTIYRIAQEQCNNIIKHAKAKRVDISLQTEDGLFKMIISDDGKGIEAGKQTKGIGLRNINSRLSILNGSANIKSVPGMGFTLEIIIPVKK
ncbi:MAG: putative signal transduction histidine kinase, partial [Chitinophagaceae bacterium]|nr:putative signal transduction histidine kinase [Chitinophagaceae bacterium]